GLGRPASMPASKQSVCRFLSLQPGILGILGVSVAFSCWSEGPSNPCRFLSLYLTQRPRQDL
ncbi:hypothetical protein A2U01_0085251, partial [Trifolium medium]|nr:hypothetical protein [Trifolium medium]